MGQNNKTASSTFPWKDILGFLGVVLAAYIGYLGIRSQIETPIQATQTAEARITLNGSSPETLANQAVIKVQVIDVSSGENIPNATITLQIEVLPSETNITDSEGVALFYLEPTFINKSGVLQVEANGYNSYKKNITITEKKPFTVPLEPKSFSLSSSPLAPTPTPTTIDASSLNFMNDGILGNWIIVVGGGYKSIEHANSDLRTVFSSYTNTAIFYRNSDIRTAIIGFSTQADAQRELKRVQKIRSVAYLKQLNEWCPIRDFYSGYIKCR